jgi:hypothetical protein
MELTNVKSVVSGLLFKNGPLKKRVASLFRVSKRDNFSKKRTPETDLGATDMAAAKTTKTTKAAPAKTTAKTTAKKSPKAKPAAKPAAKKSPKAKAGK